MKIFQMNFLVPLGPSRNTKKRFFSICLLAFFTQALSPQSNAFPKQKVIVISLDGFPASYLDSPEWMQSFPNLERWRTGGNLWSVETVEPSVTYPAHVSMVTGKDPERHGIFSNSPLDPFDRNDQGWQWYSEDIQVPTLFDACEFPHCKSLNLFWPVTVGERGIFWNIPQIWRKKNAEDLKLLRSLSTSGLWKEVERNTGISLSEESSDRDRFKAFEYLWRTKEPDLSFLYTTDIDSAHHSHGLFSEIAKARILEWDNAFGKFLTDIKFKERKDIQVILVSDHGFTKSTSQCSPNIYLMNKGFLDPQKEEWKFYFKGNGGTGLLLAKSKEIWNTEIEIAFQNDLASNCPGLAFQKNNYKLPNGFWVVLQLEAREGMVLSSTKKGNLYAALSQPIYGHGFSPKVRSMRTILGYSGKRKEEWETIRSVHTMVCEILNLNCENG